MSGRSIVLFGMMGTGKSTVGELVAAALERPHVDTDDAVVARAGSDIATLIRSVGEQHFRQLERAVIAALGGERPCVVSVGGGAVLDPSNVEHLRRLGVLIELRAPADTIVARLRADTSGVRPLLTDRDPLLAVTALLAERTPRYREVGDAAVDATEPAEHVARAVLACASAIPGVLTDDERSHLTGVDA